MPMNRCDVFTISILLANIILVSVRWKMYHLCKYPSHIWMLVDYTTMLIFTLLRLADNALAAGMRVDSDPHQRYARFCGRIAAFSVLALLIYPLLWAFTITGTVWFTTPKDCFSDKALKWIFLIWLLAQYFLLATIACGAMLKWLVRRQAHLLRAQQQGIPMSEFGISSEYQIEHLKQLGKKRDGSRHRGFNYD